VVGDRGGILVKRVVPSWGGTFFFREAGQQRHSADEATRKEHGKKTQKGRIIGEKKETCLFKGHQRTG